MTGSTEELMQMEGVAEEAEVLRDVELIEDDPKLHERKQKDCINHNEEPRQPSVAQVEADRLIEQSLEMKFRWL